VNHMNGSKLVPPNTNPIIPLHVDLHVIGDAKLINDIDDRNAFNGNCVMPHPIARSYIPMERTPL